MVSSTLSCSFPWRASGAAGRLHAIQFAGVERGQPGVDRCAVGCGACAAVEVVPQALQIGRSSTVSGRSTPEVVAGDVGQRGQPGAELIAGPGGSAPLVARVIPGRPRSPLGAAHHRRAMPSGPFRAADRRFARRATGWPGCPGCGRAFAVVVLLSECRNQATLWSSRRCPAQAQAGVLVGVGHRLAAAAEAQLALDTPCHPAAWMVILFRRRGFALVTGAAHRQSQACPPTNGPVNTKSKCCGSPNWSFCWKL